MSSSQQLVLNCARTDTPALNSICEIRRLPEQRITLRYALPRARSHHNTGFTVIRLTNTSERGGALAVLGT